MKFLGKIFLVAIMPVCIAVNNGNCCTTFFMDQNGEKIFGKNYDWHLGSGMIIINQRGVEKKGIHGIGKDPIENAKWTSKYGSLTFNQYGREMPTGGMNEAGLVVHLMALHETQYPQPDTRNPIKNLQWIQYQLDNFDKVEKVIKVNTKIRILNDAGPGLHFLVADKTGDCASIEWIEGKFIYHAKDTLPYKVLANNAYSESLGYLKRHHGFGGTLDIKSGSFSLDRFVRAAAMLEKLKGRSAGNGIEDAFDILKNVAQSSTQWSIVYDINNSRVHFMTMSNKHIRSIDLNTFDLSCRGPVKVIDIDKITLGPITSSDFSDYTREQNKYYVEKPLSGSGVPAHFIEYIVRYPETTACGQ